MTKTRILIVEDDMIIASNISLQLSKLGYEVIGIESHGEDALHHAIENNPDIILMDINLKGKINGIETARAIQKEVNIPLIYLTGNSDEASFQKARETHPFGFISKPFDKLNLERTIALAEESIKDKEQEKFKPHTTIETLEDRIFIRHNNKSVKVMIKDILYLEAERNYCKIVTFEHTFTIVSPLGQLWDKLENSNLIRVHRSFVVNISQLDAVSDSHLEIKKKIIPISKGYKDQLFKRIRKI